MTFDDFLVGLGIFAYSVGPFLLKTLVVMFCVKLAIKWFKE